MVQRRRRFGALMVVALLVLGTAACGDDDDDDTGSVEVDDGDTGEDAAGETAEVTVGIDGKGEDFSTSAFAYFPSKVQVHPGDTVVYESRFTGEPHTITFGTLVTDAVEAFRTMTPEQLESEGPPPPELEAAFSKLPAMLPEGPGDANQVSANPCFVATGDLPADGTKQCDVTEPEPFTGTETFYNSGFMPDGEKFSVQLAEDIAPGNYVAFCMLHFTEMISEVEVVAEDVEVPSAEEVEAQGQEELDELLAAAATAFEAASTAGEENTVAAGIGSEEAPKILVTEFAPESLEVAAGDTITWKFAGPHTVSFNAPEDARVLLNKGDDGGFHLNETSLAPAGFEGPPPPEGEPQGPPPPIEGGTWDGTGFFSSGLGFDGFSVAISEQGTYEYICLIHPEMEGTVTVS